MFGLFKKSPPAQDAGDSAALSDSRANVSRFTGALLSNASIDFGLSPSSNVDWQFDVAPPAASAQMAPALPPAAADSLPSLAPPPSSHDAHDDDFAGFSPSAPDAAGAPAGHEGAYSWEDPLFPDDFSAPLSKATSDALEADSSDEASLSEPEAFDPLNPSALTFHSPDDLGSEPAAMTFGDATAPLGPDLPTAESPTPDAFAWDAPASPPADDFGGESAAMTFGDVAEPLGQDLPTAESPTSDAFAWDAPTSPPADDFGGESAAMTFGEVAAPLGPDFPTAESSTPDAFAWDAPNSPPADDFGGEPAAITFGDVAEPLGQDVPTAESPTSDAFAWDAPASPPTDDFGGESAAMAFGDVAEPLGPDLPTAESPTPDAFAWDAPASPPADDFGGEPAAITFGDVAEPLGPDFPTAESPTPDAFAWDAPASPPADDWANDFGVDGVAATSAPAPEVDLSAFGAIEAISPENDDAAPTLNLMGPAAYDDGAFDAALSSAAPEDLPESDDSDAASVIDLSGAAASRSPYGFDEPVTTPDLTTSQPLEERAPIPSDFPDSVGHPHHYDILSPESVAALYPEGEAPMDAYYGEERLTAESLLQEMDTLLYPSEGALDADDFSAILPYQDPFTAELPESMAPQGFEAAGDSAISSAADIERANALLQKSLDDAMGVSASAAAYTGVSASAAPASDGVEDFRVLESITMDAACRFFVVEMERIYALMGECGPEDAPSVEVLKVFREYPFTGGSIFTIEEAADSPASDGARRYRAQVGHWRGVVARQGDTQLTLLQEESA